MSTPNAPDLAAENAELRARLAEAEETLEAIRTGGVGALVTSGPEGDQVSTLQGAETPYRMLIESMNEGAATLAPDGTILYCNPRFAEMVATPAEQVIGSSLWKWVVSAQEPVVRSLVGTAQHAGARAELTLSAPRGPGLPVLLSLRPIELDSHTIGVVAADLSERKRAEEALRQANDELEQRVATRTEDLRREREWLSVTLSSIGDALIATDAAGCITFLNPVAKTLTGWPREEALGQPVQRVFRIVDEATRIPGGDIVERVLREGAAVKLANNTCLIARAGKEIPIEDSAAPIKDSDGKVAGVVLVFHDVSEKRRAQHALRESEERLRLLVNGTKDCALFMLDPTGRITTWNEGGRRLKGYEPLEIIGQHFSVFYTPEDVAAGKPARELETAQREGKYEEEGERVRKDGSRFWAGVLITPLWDVQGRLRGFSKVIRDITERKQAAQEVQRLLSSVQQEKETLSAMLSSISDEVWFADTNRKFTLANPAALREFGLDPAKGIGVEELAASLEVLRPDGSPRPVEEAPSLRALQGEIVRDLEETVRTPASRELRYRQVSAAPVRDDHGAIIGAVSVVRDITEQKRVEDTLRFLAQSAAAVSGEDFFQTLARHLGESLGMDYVCIDRLEEGSLAARTLAIYFEGKFEDNVSYTLKDTPCGDVVGKTICCFPKDVRHLFPKDLVLQQMVAESYVGVTLWGSHAQPIGLIAVLGRQPLADTRLATSILQVVAVRAAAELERQQAEQALRASEQRYRSLFEHMLDGFAYCRMLYENGLPRDFIYLEVNSAFMRLTGLKNVAGKKVSEVIPGVRETNPELFEIYGRVALTGQPERFETWLPSLGSWFAVSVYSPRKEHFVAVFDNITDRKRAEEALRLSEERYRLLYDKNPDGVFVVDTSGRFLMANPACEVISGYSVAELMEKSFMDLCAPDLLARTIEYFERGLLEHRSLQLETALLRKDGRRVEVWVAGGPSSADGKTVTVHCTARDITERKQMEEEIRRRAEELAATNEELTRFNEAMVGRELRMIDLKQEIDSLCAQLGEPPRYGPIQGEEAEPAQ